MRIYRALLHLYPTSFRAEYGEEMADIFRARLRDAGGSVPRLVVWLAVLPEIIMNALAVHWDISSRICVTRRARSAAPPASRSPPSWSLASVSAPTRPRFR
jgi:hypothetical protein